ncbi:hotdog fold thioesterase [Nocardia sp. CDC159]|uniref:Hotdog fold thioesterase n=1 Tax=Nocardia pulmonis TaxID=2951408 RepID=A0A9X2E260_9NOCA|nr:MULTISPECIES: hotdog fold domain-containing protein [Nocardia]MCM6772220.1 hotdog fold thioesterase [Nocardia pulmonis]MCM6785122.1 hotdog fold thioesterase [Nocardia sp. CDC159]
MTTHPETIMIPAHIHGYPGVAFGGYVAGLLAARAERGLLRVAPGADTARIPAGSKVERIGSGSTATRIGSAENPPHVDANGTAPCGESGDFACLEPENNSSRGNSGDNSPSGGFANHSPRAPLGNDSPCGRSDNDSSHSAPGNVPRDRSDNDPARGKSNNNSPRDAPEDSCPRGGSDSDLPRRESDDLRRGPSGGDVLHCPPDDDALRLDAGNRIASIGSESLGLRVDFRRAIPVETPITLAETGTGWALLDAEAVLLAEVGRDVGPDVVVPEPPSWARAREASAKSAAVERAIPDCYGCGTACRPGRGLRLYPWGLRGRNMVVAAWVPDRELAGPDGLLPPPTVWAALDCPGGWAAIVLSGMRPGGVTAAMRVTRHRPMRAGEKYLVHAWPIATEGRKYTVGVAISTPEGLRCATAEALWIEPRG